MNWQQVRQAHPNQWLVLEATAAHSDGDQRVVEALDVVASVDEAQQAMKRYLELHKQEPARELYVAHTSREELAIEERRWAGVRAR